VSANRRDFIKFVVAGAVSAGCPIDLSLVSAQSTTGPNNHPAMVDGENNQICHEVRDGKVFSRPPVSAKHDVVIVGGGVSGLTAAYRLQHLDGLLLEKEPHWGGNAYAMEYEGNAYGTGSAFLWTDSEAFHFAKEIGLDPLPVNSPDGSFVNGQFTLDTWGDGINKLPYPPVTRESFKKFKKEMMEIDLDQRAVELDTVAFSRFMGDYPKEIKQWWDGFGLSNWGAVSDETSAALAVSEFQDIVVQSHTDNRYTWPGGLGALTKKLAEILQPKYGSRMQTGATTIAVVPGKDDVQVTYVSGSELITVSAKAVIMATPKFITRRIVDGLPERQSAAMHQIRYAPYCVVNLIFDKPVFNKGYDNWCPGNTFTDFVVADWVIRKKSGYKPKYNILSCYTPLREAERASLLTDDGTRELAANVLRDFQKLTPAFNVDPVEVHIYRRGHPMFMATPGLYTRVLPLVRQPMDRVFFANTDSEGPESTTNEAIVAAGRAVRQVEARLAGIAAKERAMAG
jgi:protoporphyrinogen/coproporphyrinogen III oxidase